MQVQLKSKAVLRLGLASMGGGEGEILQLFGRLCEQSGSFEQGRHRMRLICVISRVTTWHRGRDRVTESGVIAERSVP